MIWKFGPLKGLAVRFDETRNATDFGPEEKVQVGTKRYMAPELLANNLNAAEFDNFCRADIYSLGLIFWEILQRTEITGQKCPEYKQPYEDFFPSDPSIEEMKHVVVEKKARPEFRENLGKICSF